jgi:DNA-binding transcriptional MocR family regulator
MARSTILDAVRHAMKIPAGRLRGYGHPLGFPSLRQHLAASCRSLFAVEPEQVLLTHGATHAFDLILRTLTRPATSCSSRTPATATCWRWCATTAASRSASARRERPRHGRAGARSGGHQPKLMFVNTVLQNPLGTSLSQAQAHRLLALAEQFDFWLVEDDIYRELAAPAKPRWRRWTACAA